MTEPIMKWRTASWTGATIERIECTRESVSCVWINMMYAGKWTERRVKKISTGLSYHDTWEAAREYLLGRAQRDVVRAHRRLDEARGFEWNVRGLKNPEDLGRP